MPAPPSIWRLPSNPVPPVDMSIESLPAPARIVSLPARPLMKFAPSLPVMTLSRLLPWTSARAVPVSLMFSNSAPMFQLTSLTMVSMPPESEMTSPVETM